MDAGAHRNGHRQGGGHALDGFDGHGMAHAHARPEVGVGDALGRQRLHERAHDAVAARIPAGRDDRHGIVGLGFGVERAAQLHNLAVNVEAVDRADAQPEAFLGILLDAARGRGQDGYVHVLEFADAAHHVLAGRLHWSVFRRVATHDAGYLKVGRFLKRLKHILADISISDNGCSNLFHAVFFF